MKQRYIKPTVIFSDSFVYANMLGASQQSTNIGTGDFYSKGKNEALNVSPDDDKIDWDF